MVFSRFCIFILITYIFCSGHAWAGIHHYTLDTVRDEDSTKVFVTYMFQAPDSKSTRLVLEPNGASGENIYEIIKLIDQDNADILIQRVQDTPNAFDIDHEPKQWINLRYEISIPPQMIQDGYGERDYYPFIESDFVYLEGRDFILLPESLPHTEIIDVQIKFITPHTWKVAKTIEKEKFSLVREDVWGTIFFAGKDLRVTDIMITPDQKVRLAVLGDFEFFEHNPDDILESKIHDIFRALLNFWNDTKPMDYLIALREVSDISTNGSAIYESFRANLERNIPLKNLLMLFAHEVFHRYNGKKIRFKQKDLNHTWFMEGVTNYYTDLIGLQAGVIDRREFIKRLNQTIENYELSPARNATSKNIETLFWKNIAYKRLPYHQGHLLGHLLDAHIRKGSKGQKSLDDFMKALLKLFESNPPEGFFETTFYQILDQNYHEDVSSVIIPHVKSGQSIDIKSAIDLGACFRVQKSKIQAFDRGFDRSVLKAQGAKITGVAQGSQAYKAGLRNGQVYKGIDMYGNPSVLATVRVEVDGKVKKIKYYPTKNLGNIYQVKIKKEKYWTDDSCWQRLYSETD